MTPPPDDAAPPPDEVPPPPLDPSSSMSGPMAATEDPVAIAALAIARLRARARNDLAELRTQYRRHDGVVLLCALLVIVIAGRIHRRLVTPPTETFAERGFTFERTKAWLAPEPVPPAPPRLVRDFGARPAVPAAQPVYDVAFTSAIDPAARFEVLIDQAPAWRNIVALLDLDRRNRWGELYSMDASSIVSIDRHDWLRTEFHYAHAASKGDQPMISRAVELATVDRTQLYVVTFFGDARQIGEMEDQMAPTFKVASQLGAPLVPQAGRLVQRGYPDAVSQTFDSTVMVVVADLIDGRLRPRGAGAGVVVGRDGSILTNYHVVHDRDGRLHDVFVIGRFSKPDEAPQLFCAGRPNRSKLERERDLALIKCDMDLDGRAWNARTSTRWIPARIDGKVAVRQGERLWVMGYPDVGGGGLTVSQGLALGQPTGAAPGSDDDFIKTDASISHGNSGGPVVDDAGNLVGLATAFRIKVNLDGTVVEAAKAGLIRPIEAASELLAISNLGWIPREGRTDVELEPSAVEAAAEGVTVSTRVLDAANDAPITDALVMVLRPGVSADSVDVNRFDDLVLAWGRSNTAGEVFLKQPVPKGTYSVLVQAPGYNPLKRDGDLRVDDKTAQDFQPWPAIWLEAK